MGMEADRRNLYANSNLCRLCSTRTTECKVGVLLQTALARDMAYRAYQPAKIVVVFVK